MLWRSVARCGAIKLYHPDARARLGLDGPEVIEQESGVDGGTRVIALWRCYQWWRPRYAIGLADALVETIHRRLPTPSALIAKGVPPYMKLAGGVVSNRIGALDTSRQWGLESCAVLGNNGPKEGN